MTKWSEYKNSVTQQLELYWQSSEQMEVWHHNEVGSKLQKDKYEIQGFFFGSNIALALEQAHMSVKLSENV